MPIGLVGMNSPLKIAESFNLKKDLIEPIKTAELKQMQ